MWTIRFWVPLGSGLMFLQAISELIKNIAALMGKLELTSNSDEVAEAVESVMSTEHLLQEEAKEAEEIIEENVSKDEKEGDK